MRINLYLQIQTHINCLFIAHSAIIPSNVFVKGEFEKKTKAHEFELQQEKKAHTSEFGCAYKFICTNPKTHQL